MIWRRFFERRRRDEDLSNEINSYIDHEIEWNLARGMDNESARDAAQRKLGNRTLIQEEVYRMNSIDWKPSGETCITPEGCCAGARGSRWRQQWLLP